MFEERGVVHNSQWETLLLGAGCTESTTNSFHKVSWRKVIRRILVKIMLYKTCFLVICLSSFDSNAVSPVSVDGCIAYVSFDPL